jgi:hypothetical protein
MSGRVLDLNPAEKPMKRLLRRRDSREYFRAGGWTTNPEEAESFGDVLEAAEVCARYGLTDVELSLCFEAGAEDVFCTGIR